jgi:hypothetical protein
MDRIVSDQAIKCQILSATTIQEEAMMKFLAHRFALPALIAAGTLAACVAPPPGAQTGSRLVHWPERQLLLAGDPGSGAVRVFRLIGERPVPVAVWRSGNRSRVLDIRIDRDCGGVWVLGDRGMELHAADSGTVVARAAASPAAPPLAGAGGAACGGRFASAPSPGG